MRRPEPDLLARAPALYVHGTGGVGTPEGVVGAGIGVTPTDWSSIEVGAGATYGRDSEPQLSAMASLRGRVSSLATLGLGSGVSIGRAFHWDNSSIFEEASLYKTWHWPLWLNTELQVRHALSADNSLRFHAGFAKSIATGPSDCGAQTDRSCREVHIIDLVPYVGAGFEHDF